MSSKAVRKTKTKAKAKKVITNDEDDPSTITMKFYDEQSQWARRELCRIVSHYDQIIPILVEMARASSINKWEIPNSSDKDKCKAWTVNLTTG